MHKQFGDWYLAFAAYNCGETRVQRHINYFNTRDFWELKNLPKETQNYIPSILAIIFISKNPEKYNFKVNPDPYFEWETIEINKSVKIKDIAKCSGINEKILKQYNSELLRDIVYVNGNKPYMFKMPLGYNPDFDSLFALIPESKSEGTYIISHKVKSGESYWLLATRHNTTITAICELNNLDRNKPLRMGKIIKIPVGDKSKYKKQLTKHIYKVKRGINISYLNDGKNKYHINGIENRIEQIIANLLDNAISFSDDNKDITVRVSKSKDERININVLDEGQGFKEKDTNKIFKRFYSNRPDRFGQHSGLGLNIVKNLVELHNGSIKASNRLDQKGASMEITFPIA